jgi:hypothetical protein
LWGSTSSEIGSAEMAAAFEALEDRLARGLEPAVAMAIIATRRGECERDQTFGPATAA